MFSGIWTLTKLILRRDRVKLPIWIIGIVVSLLAMIPLLSDVYGDSKSLAVLFQTFSSNPAGLFLTGPMDLPTFGALMTIETLLWWGLVVAFMNTLLIIRHTRQNEEIGAQELILSGQVHRSTGLVAVLLVAFLMNLLVVVGLGAGMSVLEDSWGVSNAWLYALTLGLFGFSWAALAAFVAQLVESSRSANGILASTIGVAFIVRGIGDFMGRVGADGLLQPTWLSWLSPFGWMQATRSLTFPEWWPLIIPTVFIIFMVPIAFWILNRRDVEAGVLPSRKGHARAAAWLKTPLGFTWHLQKNIFIGWLFGVLAMVITIGSLAPSISSVYESSEAAKHLVETIGGTGALIPAFLSTMLSIVVLMVFAYAIQGIGKLRSEEVSGHLENLFATRLSRLQWLALHGLVVLLGGISMIILAGAFLAICVNVWSDYNVSVWEYIFAGLSYLPILLAFVSGYIFLFGILPRMASLLTWTYYGFVAFMAWLGPLLKLDQKVMDVSIMTHVAAAPAEDIVMKPLLIISITAILLLIIGLFAFQRRNLTTS